MKKVNCVLISLVLVGLADCAYNNWPREIPPHRGDGVFRDISRWHGPFRVSGYEISMPEFDLGTPRQAEYIVSGLTRMRGGCLVYLAISDPENKWWSTDEIKELKGELELQMRDSRGNLVVDVQGQLGQYIWMGTRNMHGLYQLDKSKFWSTSSEEYRLHFRYRPDPKLAGFKRYVWLQYGGRI